MITEPTEPQRDSEEFWPNDEQKQDLLKLCEQITGESQTSSPLHRRRPNRGHPNGLRGFLTIAAAMAIALGLLSMGWFSSFHFFGVAEQAKELQIQAETHEEQMRVYKQEAKFRLVENMEAASDLMARGKYYEAFVRLDALAATYPSEKSRDAKVNAINQLHRELFGADEDLTQLDLLVAEILANSNN